MRVDVGEARSDHQAIGVNGPRALPREAGADRGDAITLDRHVGSDPRGAAAVQHRAVLDQERPGHAYCAASMIFTDFILSPFLMLSTMFMPETTLPKTTYPPSR